MKFNELRDLLLFHADDPSLPAEVRQDILRYLEMTQPWPLAAEDASFAAWNEGVRHVFITSLTVENDGDENTRRIQEIKGGPNPYEVLFLVNGVRLDFVRYIKRCLQHWPEAVQQAAADRISWHYQAAIDELNRDIRQLVTDRMTALGLPRPGGEEEW